MADGKPGDETHKPVDQATPQQPQGDKGHTAKLQDDSNPGKDAPQKPADTTTVKDSTHGPSERALDKVKDTTQKPAEDSMAHLTKAQVAANEIAGYVKAGKKETDTVTVKGPDGKDKTESVADRVKELKQIVDTECSTAVGGSNNINQKNVAHLLQVARDERNALAKDLGVSSDKFNTTAIKDLKAATTDSATADKLDQLMKAQANVDKFKLWENTPAYTRMLYASFKAGGLTDVATGMQKDANGGLKPSQKDVLDAVQLLTEAGGNNKDLRTSKLYLQAVGTVLPKLENSSDKVKTITTDMEKATQAGAAGNKTEQERLLKEAVTMADQTNTAAIAQMLRDPRFVASQRNPAVLTDLANNVVMSSTARLQYAQFLADQGRFGEAQGLALRVKTECPEVMYSHDDKDPTKLDYAKSRFVDMAKLDASLANSTSVPPNQIKNMLDDFSSAMSKGQIESKDGVRGAEDLMKDMKAVALKKVNEIADGQKGLDTAQKDLDQKRRDLDAKKYLTDDAKLLEQKQLDREQAILKQQKDMLAADAKEATRLSNVVKLYEAGLDVAEDKRSSARALLAEVKASDPSMCPDKGPDGKDSFYSTLSKAAEEPGWWDRNWRKVAYVGAVVAGGVVGALTFWSGPGALVFGAGTTAAIMTSVGVGVTAGALAGGATFLGTHEAVYHAGLTKEQVDMGKDFTTGMQAGALGAVTTIGLPAMSAMSGIGTGAVAADGTVTAASWGLKALRLGGVGFSGSVPFAASDYLSHDPKDRSIKSELITVGTMTGLPMLGVAGGAGFRALGWMKAAPTVIQASTEAPKVFTLGNGLTSTSFLALDQGIKAIPEYQIADMLGPAYAYGDKPGTASKYIQQSTNIFGPYNATRGWEAHRQSDDDISGERTMIQSQYSQIERPVSERDSMATSQNAKPIVNTESDFTDAEKLGDQPAPPAQTQSNK